MGEVAEKDTFYMKSRDVYVFFCAECRQKKSFTMKSRDVYVCVEIEKHLLHGLDE